MSGGGGKGGGKTGSGDKTKNVSTPWAPLVPYLTGQAQGKNGAQTGLFPESARLYNSDTPMQAPFDQNQIAGQNTMLNYANNFGSMYSPYMQSSQQALKAPNVNANPYLDQYANAATRPLQNQLDYQTMPGIRQAATQAGQYGGSRQGIAEGVASGLTNQAIGDTRAQIYSNAYGQGLDQQAKALALYPQVLQAGQIPGQIQQQVGQQIQDQNQANSPFSRLGWYGQMLGMNSAANNAGKSTTSDASKQGWLDTGLNGISVLSALFG